MSCSLSLQHHARTASCSCPCIMAQSSEMYVLIIEYIRERVLSYLKRIPNYEPILTFMSRILHFIALIYVIFVQKSMSINAFYLLEQNIHKLESVTKGPNRITEDMSKYQYCSFVMTYISSNDSITLVLEVTRIILCTKILDIGIKFSIINRIKDISMSNWQSPNNVLELVTTMIVM